VSNTIKKPPATRGVLQLIRLAYADQLITPKAFEAGQPEKYGCTCLLPPDHPGIDLLETAINAAVTARFGPKPEWPKRLRGLHYDPIVKDCGDFPAIGIREPGWCFVRATTQDAPGIVNARVEPIAKADLRSEVYSGRWADVTYNVFCYERQTGSGVSLGLNNIRLLKHDDRLGAARPKPEDEFDPEDLPDDDFVPRPRRSA
jgi:hypothetical protein